MVTFTLLLITICYCYFITLYTINTFDSRAEEIEAINRLRCTEIERRAAWKIISYILVFILQWLSVQIEIITKWTTVKFLIIIILSQYLKIFFLKKKLSFFRFVVLGLILQVHS